MQSALGSSIDGMTPVFAARWTMTSAPCAARRASSSSSMSPTRSSTGESGRMGPTSVTSSKGVTASRSSRSPTARLSTTLTECPPWSATRARTRAVPRKPQPPVTSQFIPRSLSRAIPPRPAARPATLVDLRSPEKQPTFLAEFPRRARCATVAKYGYCRTAGEGGLMTAQEQSRSAGPDEEPPGYVFEQFRVERGCLGYVVAHEKTRRAAVVDPEIEMVEPMLDFVF